MNLLFECANDSCRTWAHCRSFVILEYGKNTKLCGNVAANAGDKSIFLEYFNFRKMWFFAIIFAMVGLYISGRKWGPKLYFYYRPRLPYILPYRKKPRPLTPPPTLSIVESDLDAAKKKFDLSVIKSIIIIIIHHVKKQVQKKKME